MENLGFVTSFSISLSKFSLSQYKPPSRSSHFSHWNCSFLSRPFSSQDHKKTRLMSNSVQCSTTKPSIPLKAPIRVLFVCLGNICRSPAAEAVFKALVKKDNLLEVIHVDSCGTGGGSESWYREGGFSYHEGESADERMAFEAVSRGYEVTSRSRPLTRDDITNYDFIIAMDTSNRFAVLQAARYWGGKELETLADSKVWMMQEFSSEFIGQVKQNGRVQDKSIVPKVPDPYYGGSKGFVNVMDLLENSCQGLLDIIKSSLSAGV